MMMRKLDLGQTISIFANLGVIFGILLLVVEIRQNNDLIADEAIRARAASVQAIWSQLVSWQDQITNDSEVAGIYEGGLANFEQLSRGDQIRFDSLMRSYLRIMSQVMQARAEGLIGLGSENIPAEDRQIESDVLRHLDRPGFRQWWSTADRRGMSNRVIAFIAGLEHARE